MSDETQILKVKRLHADALLPSRAHENDAGWDLTTIGDANRTPEGYLSYQTGLSIQLPSGYDALIFPRSSISNYDLVLANSLGLIDEGYRGELIVRFKRACRFDEFDDAHPMIDSSFFYPRIYKKGDKIAQLVLRKRPHFDIVEVDTLTDSTRGSGGFGSTGN